MTTNHKWVIDNSTAAAIKELVGCYLRIRRELHGSAGHREYQHGLAWGHICAAKAIYRRNRKWQSA